MSGFDLNVVTASTFHPLYCTACTSVAWQCMPSPRLWWVNTPFVMIILLLLSNLGFCSGLLHSCTLQVDLGVVCDYDNNSCVGNYVHYYNKRCAMYM